MSYTKQTWEDGKSPLNAERMNHIEDGIAQNATDVTKLSEEKANAIVSSAIGNNIKLNDCSAGSRLQSVAIYGKTTQSGIPTHSNPIELVNTGSSGNIAITVAGETDNSIMVVPTPNGLPGIPVVSGGNYTDDNGQMWLCDEIDYERGVYVKNVVKYVFDGSRTWQHSLVGGKTDVYRHYIVQIDLKNPADASSMPALLCSHYSRATANQTYAGKIDSTISLQAWGNGASTAIAIYDTGYTGNDNAAWQAYLAQHPVTCLIGLAKPVETALDAEVIAAIEYAVINGKSATVTNSDNAGMRVSYAIDTKAYIDNADNDSSLAAMNKYVHVSRIIFTGDVSEMTKDNAVILGFEYRGAENYINDSAGTGKREDGVIHKGYAKVKWQGTSSINFPKKNYTVTFYEDAGCTVKLPLILREKWGAQSKYCMKANWIDPSMCRNVIAAKLWAECVLSRPTACESYVRMSGLPNAGAIDGYPIFTFINDGYVGLYTMNIPKDDWMFGMNDGAGTNVVLCGEAWNDATYFDGNAVIDGTDWNYEVKPANTSGVVASFNAIYAALSMPETTEAEISAKKSAIMACVDIYSVLDYWIYLDKLCITDNTGKNQLMVTYDGIKWIMSAYDLDTAFGLHWAGASYYDSSKTLYGNNLLRTVARLFETERAERKAVLDNILSASAIYNKIDNFLIDVPEEAFRLEAKLWPDMAGANSNGIVQIKSFLAAAQGSGGGGMTEEQAKQLKKNTEDIEQLSEEMAFKPEDYGLPVLTLNGDCTGMTKDNPINLAYTFMDMSGNVDVKKQGSSSINTGVEIGGAFDDDVGGLFNFTLKFPEAFEAKAGWGAQKKYVFKSNAIDHTHARNLMSCKKWGEMVRTRSNENAEAGFDPALITGLVNLTNGSTIANGVTVSDGVITTNASIYANGSVGFSGMRYKAGSYTLSFDVWLPQNDVEPTDGGTVYVAAGVGENQGAKTYIVTNGIPYETWVHRDVELSFDFDNAMIGMCGGQSKNAQFKNVRVNGVGAEGADNVIGILRQLPNGGAVDGFPIIVVLNDKYYALGTFNIPKDGWMFGSPKAILCADTHCDATKFRALATLNGDFELEYVEDEDNADWVLPSINTAIQAAIDGNIETLGQYIDIPSAIDYYIHTVDEMATDGTDKNYILVTFDGVKWYFSAYDRDTTYGLQWTGKGFNPANMGLTYAEYANSHRVMYLIYSNKRADLTARAIELREGIASEAHVADLFTNFGASIPAEVLAQNCRRWPLLRSTSVSNTAQILNWYRLRRQFIDKEIDAM